jgi:hypothetical protein
MRLFDAKDPFPGALYPGRLPVRQNRLRGPAGCVLWLWLIVLLLLALVSFSWNITITWGPTIVEVQTTPTLIVESVSDLRSVIHIHAGQTSGQIVLRPVRPLDWPFGAPEVYQETSDQRTVIYDVSSEVAGTFDITVPMQTNLKVDANRASVLVEGITGQMTLNVISGTLTVRNATILGPSLLREDSGELYAQQDQLRGAVALDTTGAGITFQGSLARSGSYHIAGNGGPINLALESRTAVHIDASTNAGAITSNLVGARVQRTESGFALHMDIGAPPRAQLSLYNNGGKITVNEQEGG